MVSEEGQNARFSNSKLSYILPTIAGRLCVLEAGYPRGPEWHCQLCGTFKTGTCEPFSCDGHNAESNGDQIPCNAWGSRNIDFS